MENDISGLEKLANGFKNTEMIEDYALDAETGELKLLKRRITTKFVPPDLDAYKMLYGQNNFEKLSDEELEKEKTRLIKSLIQSEKEGGNEVIKNGNQKNNIC